MYNEFGLTCLPIHFRNDPVVKQYNSLGREKCMFAEPIKLEEPDTFDDKFASVNSAEAPTTAVSTPSHE